MTTTTKETVLTQRIDHYSESLNQSLWTKRVHILMISALVVMTGLFWLTPLDTVVSQRFLGPSGWVGSTYRLFAWFYFPLNAIFFVLPILIGSVIVFMSLAPTVRSKWAQPYRRIGLFMMTSTLIGAGLFNSFLLKIIFARPRPYAVFSGEADYLRPLEIGVAYWGGMDMSFPSGHVSMATVSVVFFFAFRTAINLRGKVMKWALGVALPLIAAPIMTVSRVAYGDHFLSDGIFAMALTYGVVCFMYHQMKVPEMHRCLEANEASNAQCSLTRQDILFILIGVGIVLALMVILMIRFDGLRRLV